ncbi:glycosyltransferase family 2 protein [Lebetimonas natsushimae]|nr:glycosyltransferase family 2 protein [Lebetimonas natsushimae]
MKSEKLSIVILTKNSQKYLEKVLKSVEFADEVIIYDSGSSDKTLDIAKNFKNVKIFVDKNWEGFGKQKQKAVDRASNKWVFVLDSDEVFTDNLKKEVLEILKNPIYDAYRVARLNNFFGKWIRHCGLFPDYSIRLFNREKCKFNEREVHESVECKRVGVLNNYFLHYAYENIEEFIDKQNRYSSLGAKPNKLKAIFSPYWTFLKIYFIKLGFLDGWAGFVIAKLYSEYTFWKYVKDKYENIGN